MTQDSRNRLTGGPESWGRGNESFRRSETEPKGEYDTGHLRGIHQSTSRVPRMDRTTKDRKQRTPGHRIVDNKESEQEKKKFEVTLPHSYLNQGQPGRPCLRLHSPVTKIF